jgi:hypothetical protein
MDAVRQHQRRRLRRPSQLRLQQCAPTLPIYRNTLIYNIEHIDLRLMTSNLLLSNRNVLVIYCNTCIVNICSPCRKSMQPRIYMYVEGEYIQYATTE